MYTAYCPSANPSVPVTIASPPFAGALTFSLAVLRTTSPPLADRSTVLALNSRPAVLPSGLHSLTTNGSGWKHTLPLVFVPQSLKSSSTASFVAK